MNDPITSRMDAALERARWRFPESPARFFYLDPTDWQEFDAEMRLDWPTAAHTFSYRDIQIRSAKKSRLTTKHGCLVAIPKHLSPATRQAA